MSEPEVTDDDRRLVNDLFETFRDKTALVFGNNKRHLEFYADSLIRQCERMGCAIRFVSIMVLFRRGSERKLKTPCGRTKQLSPFVPALWRWALMLEMSNWSANLARLGPLAP